MALLESLWSEREFLVSLGILLVSTATLLAVGYLNYLALQYTRRKEEFPHFEAEKAFINPDRSRACIKLNNIGPGDCDTLKLTEAILHSGEDIKFVEIDDSNSYSVILKGEYEVVYVDIPENFRFNLDNSEIVLRFEADGREGSVSVGSGQYTQKKRDLVSWYYRRKPQ